MLTMRDHIAALKRAQAAGDQEAVDYIRGQMRDTQRQADAAEYGAATDGMSTLELARAGMGRGMMNVARNVGNMVGLVSDEDMQSAAQNDAALLNTTAGKVGNFIGETAAVTLPTMGTAGLLARAGGAAGRVAGSVIGRGAIEGATQGAITAGPGNRAQGALIGGAAGTVLPAAGAAYRAARSGVAPTAGARRLMADGVSLTPGQMNPGGTINQLEEAAQAIPYVGQIVQGARQKGYEQFQRKVVQDAAPEGLTVSAGPVDRMVSQVSQAFDNAYDFAKGFPVTPSIVRTSGGDIPLVQAFKGITNHRGTLATDEERKMVGGFLRSQLSQLRGRQNSSDDLLKIRSEIRTKIREASSNGQRQLLKNAEKQVTAALESQLPKQAIAVLKKTDAQYGKFKIVEDAVYRAKDQAGSFTPAQLSAAVRDATAKGEYARGGGRMRDLARGGVETFQARQPLTGRQAITIAPVIGAAYADPVLIGGSLAGATGLLYGTQAGRNFAAGKMGAQLTARELEREMRRRIPKAGREVTAGYSRNALVNLMNGD